MFNTDSVLSLTKPDQFSAARSFSVNLQPKNLAIRQIRSFLVPVGGISDSKLAHQDFVFGG
ncbi:hypothetical protein B6N60_04971 [Richelia sinica FACHB-800]|uniref:Uncharacterized protein n=1 Tax=Richelia sinica FACHB-800 TaxID=1357546 RepID=A0A975TD32_9NOST|nr:hypothetical protein B6N60_04971 [Richelia sinica FACHB-800]